MVSDNYLLGLDRLLHSDTTTALLRTSGEKKAKAKRAPRMKGQAKPAPRKVKDSVIPRQKKANVRCFFFYLVNFLMT